MDENMSEGHERKEKRHIEREKETEIWSRQCFLQSSKQSPLHTSLGAVA